METRLFGLALLILAGVALALVVRAWWRHVRPKWARTYLYTLWTWRLVYVGISTRPELRQRQHLAGQDGGTLGEKVRQGARPRMVVLFAGPRWLIRACEALAIAALGWMLWNEAGNPWR